MSAVPPAITPGATDHVADHAHDHGHDAGHDHAPYGWRRWLYATNHKDIGTMYLWFSFTMFLFGGILALGLRLELFQPGLQFWRPEFFNQLTTMHGLIMVFGAIMPAFVGFANWQVPLMVGAPDMAFARMNNFSFWLLPPAGAAAGGIVFRSGRSDRGGLDPLCAADGANGSGHGPRHICAAHIGCELDHGLDQHHHDDS